MSDDDDVWPCDMCGEPFYDGYSLMVSPEHLIHIECAIFDSNGYIDWGSTRWALELKRIK